MQGPDGKTYPAGTKFKIQPVKKTLEQGLAQLPFVAKVLPHESDPEKLAVKVLLSDESETQLNLIKDTFGLETLEAPVDGSKYKIAFFSKSEAGKTADDTELVIDIPEQPTAFTPKPYPSGEVQKDGELAVNNRDDLGSIDSIVGTPQGHTIRMGKKGALRDFQVIARKVEDVDGNRFIEISGVLSNFDPLNSGLKSGKKLTCMSTSTVAIPTTDGLVTAAFDPETGYHKETGEIVQASGMDVSLPAWGDDSQPGETSIRVVDGDSSYTEYMRNMFRVRIPEGKDVEAEMAAAFEKMGVDVEAAMGAPDADDELLFIKSQVVRGLMGGSCRQASKIPLAKWHDEEWLDSQLQKLGGVSMVQEAEIRVTLGGKHVVCVPSNEQKAKDLNTPFSHVGVNEDALFGHLFTQVGYSSLKIRHLNGQESSGASQTSDMHGGAAQAAYLRVDNLGMSDGHWGNVAGNPAHNCFLIFHPRLFNRMDSWIYAGDPVGSMPGETPMPKAAGITKSTNEFLVEGGVSLHDAAGAMVPTESAKKAMINRLQGEGVTEINGIPLEDFIISYQEAGSRAGVASKLAGLQEGVLP
jgi:hypothetical protein